MRSMQLANRLLLTQSADLITFLIFYIFVGTIQYEQNSIILTLMSIGGIWAVVLVKIGLPLSIRYGIKKRSMKLSKITIIVMAVATASGIVGAGFNMASIISSLVR